MADHPLKSKYQGLFDEFRALLKIGNRNNDDIKDALLKLCLIGSQIQIDFPYSENTDLKEKLGLDTITDLGIHQLEQLFILNELEGLKSDSFFSDNKDAMKLFGYAGRALIVFNTFLSAELSKNKHELSNKNSLYSEADGLCKDNQSKAALLQVLQNQHNASRYRPNVQDSVAQSTRASMVLGLIRQLNEICLQIPNDASIRTGTEALVNSLKEVKTALENSIYDDKAFLRFFQTYVAFLSISPDILKSLEDKENIDAIKQRVKDLMRENDPKLVRLGIVSNFPQADMGSSITDLKAFVTAVHDKIHKLKESLEQQINELTPSLTGENTQLSLPNQKKIKVLEAAKTRLETISRDFQAKQTETQHGFSVEEIFGYQLHAQYACMCAYERLHQVMKVENDEILTTHYIDKYSNDAAAGSFNSILLGLSKLPEDLRRGDAPLPKFIFRNEKFTSYSEIFYYLVELDTSDINMVRVYAELLRSFVVNQRKSKQENKTFEKHLADQIRVGNKDNKPVHIPVLLKLQQVGTILTGAHQKDLHEHVITPLLHAFAAQGRDDDKAQKIIQNIESPQNHGAKLSSYRIEEFNKDDKNFYGSVKVNKYTTEQLKAYLAPGQLKSELDKIHKLMDCCDTYEAHLRAVIYDQAVKHLTAVEKLDFYRVNPKLGNKTLKQSLDIDLIVDEMEDNDALESARKKSPSLRIACEKLRALKYVRAKLDYSKADHTLASVLTQAEEAVLKKDNDGRKIFNKHRDGSTVTFFMSFINILTFGMVSKVMIGQHRLLWASKGQIFADDFQRISNNQAHAENDASTQTGTYEPTNRF